MPTLFVVADEFTLMLADHPEYAELFDYVARKGRSFRIHILFASQTLDVGRIKDIDKNTSYRIGLKVASPSDQPPDHRRRGRVPHRVGPRAQGRGLPGARARRHPGQVPQHLRRRHLRPAARRANRLWCTRFPSRRLFTAGRVEPAPDTVIVTGEPEMTYAPPRKLIATIGDQLAALRTAGAAAVAAAARRADPARRPAGTRRVSRARNGAGRSARSTSRSRCAATRWSSTPTSAAANVRDPRRAEVRQDRPRCRRSSCRPRRCTRRGDVDFYCLDYGGGQLRALDDLAHVGSVASPLEPERIRRTFGELEQLLRARQSRRGHAGPGPSGDGYGEVFLVIDNLYAFSRDNTDTFNTRNPLLAKVTELVNTGLSYGIHVVITTPNWLEVPLAMRDGLGLRLELKLHDSQDSNVRVVGALRRPADSGARRSAGSRPDDGRRALPVRARRTCAMIAVINARYPGAAAPPVRLLPTDLAPAAVAPLYLGAGAGGHRPARGGPAPRSRSTSRDNPLMMVFGDAKSGKTTLLRHLIRTIRENSTAGRGRVHGDRPAAAPGRRAAVPRQRVHAEHRPDHPGDARACRR